MSWIYELTLNERVPAGDIKADWEAHFPSGVAVDDRGVSQAGLYAVVASTSRAANPGTFADDHAYVDDVTEAIELPETDAAENNPPHQFDGDGGAVTFYE